MIYVFLAEGFEELEALAPVDILRRAGLTVQTVGVTGNIVTGSHGIPVVCDLQEDKAVTDDLEAIILPGGMPGTVNLENSNVVQKFLKYAEKNEIPIGAICAAPSILGHNGLLSGKNAVCFPGFEGELTGANILQDSCVTDGNIITARGAGAAFDFAFALLSKLTGDDNSAASLRRTMVCME